MLELIHPTLDPSPNGEGVDWGWRIKLGGGRIKRGFEVPPKNPFLTIWTKLSQTGTVMFATGEAASMWRIARKPMS
jgi:hypothetical protein